MRRIMTSKDGEYLGHIPNNTVDAEIMAAGEAACLELVFRPAERDGTPVPFADYRLSIEFRVGMNLPRISVMQQVSTDLAPRVSCSVLLAGVDYPEVRFKTLRAEVS